jgi:hypothetical protein
VAVVPASIAPALREDLTPPPLPPTRIAGLPNTVETPTGPALNWQQGPVGQALTRSELGMSREVALAPMPPRRPDADDIVETGAIAYAPLPPARPSALAESNPIPGIPELRGATSLVADLASDPHPLPPPRPDIRPVAVAAASPIDIPVPTGSTIKDVVKEEKPKTRPVAEAKSPPAPKKPPATALGALLSAEPSLSMGFSSKPMGDLATNRFTGPAVKPLPVMR